ncbi:JAB domain-containing protein [Tsuneonella troitsensis]|uniref:JAB domain-containing protein n=1 Tax=Tsuneonella troitsensis TaxID=292222 RepID=UPI000708C941
MSRARIEHLAFTLHDADGQYISNFIRAGDHNGITIDYRDLIETALANNARGMLLFHNHPSGDPCPSANDVVATRQLVALCRPIGLVVHDHFVIGRKSMVSMRRRGLL